MKLTDPVPSTKLPGSFARFTAMLTMILAGLILLIGLYMYLRLGSTYEKQAIRCLILSLALAGLALAIDRDRGKSAHPPSPPSSHASAEAPRPKDLPPG